MNMRLPIGMEFTMSVESTIALEVHTTSFGFTGYWVHHAYEVSMGMMSTIGIGSNYKLVLE